MQLRIMEGNQELLRGDPDSIRVIYNNLISHNETEPAYLEMMRSELESPLVIENLRVEEMP